MLFPIACHFLFCRLFMLCWVVWMMTVASYHNAWAADTLSPPKPLEAGFASTHATPLSYPEDGPVGQARTGAMRDSRTSESPEFTFATEIQPASGVEPMPETPPIAVPNHHFGNNIEIEPSPSDAEFESDTPSSGAASDSAPIPPDFSPASDAVLPRPRADSDQREPIDPVNPPVKTAAFMRVVPGDTTADELFQHWGPPSDTAEQDGTSIYLYTIEALNHIEVIVRGGIVSSIIIRLDDPFPEDQVRGVLRTELLNAKPVLVPDVNGQIIGEVFPEKGVMFLFAAPEAGPGLLVQQIAIEQVTADPFLLRAEALLLEQPSEARRDIENAIQIQEDNAKAHWLLARIASLEGRYNEAVRQSEQAIKHDPTKPAYHLTLVQLMTQMNHIEEAKLYLEEMLPLCERYPHEKAKAISLLGDLYRMSQKPDYDIAIECHYEAIRIASELLEHNNQTVRLAAKEALFEAHLAAAKDVVWGHWDNKPAAIRKWIDKALDIAADSEIREQQRDFREFPLKIAACALAAQVVLPETNDLEPYVLELIDTAEALIQTTRDPILVRKYQWETSLALYDAVQIYQIRKQYSPALKYGELAAEYMEEGIRGRDNDLDFYLLGRLYFRMGAIHAIGTKNHRAAIEWFDSAKSVFEQLLPRINPDELGRLGETLVSMGVSYWWTGQRDEALRLTERGLKQIERATKMGTAPQAALVIPFTNLANMYNELGSSERAEYYSRQASLLEEGVK